MVSAISWGLSGVPFGCPRRKGAVGAQAASRGWQDWLSHSCTLLYLAATLGILFCCAFASSYRRSPGSLPPAFTRCQLFPCASSTPDSLTLLKRHHLPWEETPLGCTYQVPTYPLPPFLKDRSTSQSTFWPLPRRFCVLALTCTR